MEFASIDTMSEQPFQFLRQIKKLKTYGLA